MMKIKHFIGATLLAVLMTGSIAMAYDSAYPRAEIDNVEIHKLPPARLLEAKTEGTYFNNSNGLFSKLFNYIKDNEIAMTVPVEGDLQQAGMRFYVGSDAPRELHDTREVSVVELPERQVLRMGGKGSYSEKNIMESLTKLEGWLDSQPKWQADGTAYAVFWNGPITPWFLKRYEVHIPVKPATANEFSASQ
jgi:effector-binding domain-containing protein